MGDTNFIITNEILNDLGDQKKEEEISEKEDLNENKHEDKAQKEQVSDPIESGSKQKVKETKPTNQITSITIKNSGEQNEDDGYFDDLGTESKQINKEPEMTKEVPNTQLIKEEKQLMDKDKNKVQEQLVQKNKNSSEKLTVKSISMEIDKTKNISFENVKQEDDLPEQAPKLKEDKNVIKQLLKKPTHSPRKKHSMAIYKQQEITHLNKIRVLELKNANLSSQNNKLKERNSELELRMEKLEEEKKSILKQKNELESIMVKVNDENLSYEKKISMLEKELELYKNKLEIEESKVIMQHKVNKKENELEKLLETKNKKIIELEMQLKTLSQKNISSVSKISRSVRNFEMSPLSLIWDKNEVSSPRNLKKNDLPQEMSTESSKIIEASSSKEEAEEIEKIRKKVNQLEQKQKQEEMLILKPNFVASQIEGVKEHQIQDEHKVIEEEAQNKKEEIKAESKVLEKKSEKTKLEVAGDSIRKLKTIKEEPSKETKIEKMLEPKKKVRDKDQMRPSYQLKLPKNQGLNSKINQKSKQLKMVMQKNLNETKQNSNKNFIKYNHDHLNVTIYPKLVKIIEKTEKINIKQLVKQKKFHCLSDNVYRLNRWKKKKPKKLIVTENYMYIITPPYDVKRVLKLSEIEQIKTRGHHDNFICFITIHKNDEMLDYFKKNELLLFLMQIIRQKRLPIVIHSNIKSFVMLNTSNRNMVVNPNELEQYKPIYNNTFNYASRHNKLLNIYVYKDGIFTSKSYHKKVALITDLGMLLFSKVKWDLERFVPFGGKHFSKLIKRFQNYDQQK
jgi:hypothetical protein